MTEKKQKRGRVAEAPSMTAEEIAAYSAELRRRPAPVPVSEFVLLIDRARDVVRELLESFGELTFAEPPKATARMRAGLEEGDITARHDDELLAARPLAEQLLRKLANLRGARLAHPDRYEAVWQRVIDDWNETLRVHQWLTLKRLCERCGKPCPPRNPAAQLGNGVYVVTNVCSDKCRDTAKKRRQRDR